MSSEQPAEYTNEIRFGVVMYGGVSLAIYINGVSNELFELACATPAPHAGWSQHAATGTRALYQRLSWLAANPALRASYARAISGGSTAEDRPDPWLQVSTGAATQTRFTVDAISGTSAGGINGIFLAKSLANGEQFQMLKDLWIAEGDFGLLLNDAKSYEGSIPDRSARPTSLLNSDRMYAKLLDAFNKQSDPAYRLPAPVSDEVDLYVTTTDILGSHVALRLFDKVVQERRFKQNFHFSCDHAAGTNDFAAGNNPFFAFAARCTSSFPFAFEPMTLAAVERLKAVQDSAGLSKWRGFFPNLPHNEVAQDKHLHRAFGDGGYLDNKPFSYVVDVLAQRQATMPLERKLIYVEPAPKNIGQAPMPEAGQTPDALQNAIAALTSIPQYESIREDLQAVLQRNRRIERIERLVRHGEASIERGDDGPLAELLRSGVEPDWGNMPLKEMLKLYGSSFFAYRRQRAYAVTDELANRLCARWQIDADSDEQYALRALVRVWREEHYSDDGDAKADAATGVQRESINAFLDQFDFEFRIRRLGFVLRKTDQLTHLFRKFVAGPLDPAGQPLPLSELEAELLARLPMPFHAMREQEVPRAELEAALRALATIKTALVADRRSLQALYRKARPGAAADIPANRLLLEELLGRILGRSPLSSAPALQAASRQASLCRTLQESVVVRARALYHADPAIPDVNRFASLAEALQGDLEAMRFKPKNAASAATTELEQASKNSWETLGKPRLACNAQGRVITTVEAVDARDELNTPDATALRAFLAGYYMRFDSYDQISFPLYSDTGTGEPCTVEVARVSPADAISLIDEEKQAGRRKQAGTALANFGAFLDRRWRLNDVMWGRLDGAERLIHTILPMNDQDTITVRKELTDRAHQHILQDALLGEGRSKLAAHMVQALTEAGDKEKVQAYLRDRVRALSEGTSLERSSIESMLAALISTHALPEYVRTSYTVPATPDAAQTMRNAARAVTVVGRMLETISARQGKGNAASRWLARFGLMLQGLIAVSMPGTLPGLWTTHFVKVLYSFEIFALILTFIFGNADARSMATTALLATVGVHLAILVTGDLLRERWKVSRILAISLALAVLLLAGIGVWTVMLWLRWML